MTTINYTPGQILYAKSSGGFYGSWYYISVLRSATPVNSISATCELHTCCDLCIEADGSECLTFERGNGSLLGFDTSFEEIRFVDDIERRCLFDALVKAFKDHDLGWAKHFTDSSYDDIRDWICLEFNVDLDALADNINNGDNDPLVDTIYEITNYIWDALCKETGNYQACTDHVEPEMVNKAKFIEKACKIYKEHLVKFNPILKDFPTALEDAVNVFRTQMEE